MSKQRQKGTSYENHVLERYIKTVWPSATRAPQTGVNDYGDFIAGGGFGVGKNGVLIEAKKRERWDLPGWIRTILKKTNSSSSAPGDWLLVFAGDKRKEPTIDLVVMPAAQYFAERKELEEHRTWD